jgi:phosphoserine phosphatase
MAEFVLTLVAGAAARAAIDEAAQDAAAALARLGAEVDRPDPLGPGARDLPFDSADPEAAETAARAALGDRAVDVLAQPCAGRKKRLLVADLESTIIENEMLEELAEPLGLREHVAEITRRAMNGEIEFVAAVEERVALLEGLPERALAEAATRIRIMPGAAALVRTMRASGATCALVSGGFRAFSAPIRDALGFDLDVANALEVRNGHLTGRLVPPIQGREAKLATLKRLAAEGGLGLEAALAVGDGANDLPMLKAAGLGVAYHGRPAVRAEARWRVDHADLTALLYAQGFRAQDVVATDG